MPAFILDFDGTLVDTVYQHVVAWHDALQQAGYEIPMWRLHRKIGMSGALLMDALEAELGRRIDDDVQRLEEMHQYAMQNMRPSVRLCRGAIELLRTLERNRVPYAIASSGGRKDVDPFLEVLHLPGGTPVVTQEDAENAKPDPQLFLTAARKLDARSEDAVVVGDSVWDMLAARRAHFLGVGLLTGGYSESEMTAAGAYRVYADPGDLRVHLHETGVRLENEGN